MMSLVAQLLGIRPRHAQIAIKGCAHLFSMGNTNLSFFLDIDRKSSVLGEIPVSIAAKPIQSVYMKER
jgi:hypothetical protein